MDFPFCACNAEIAEEDLQAQFRHRLSMRNKRKPQRIEQSYCFPAEITWQKVKIFRLEMKRVVFEASGVPERFLGAPPFSPIPIAVTRTLS